MQSSMSNSLIEGRGSEDAAIEIEDFGNSVVCNLRYTAAQLSAGQCECAWEKTIESCRDRETQPHSALNSNAEVQPRRPPMKISHCEIWAAPSSSFECCARQGCFTISHTRRC